MKTFHFFLILTGLLLSLTLVNCGQNAETQSAAAAENAASNNPANMEDAMAQAQKQVDAIQGDNKDVTPVNFRKLKELLPEKLLGMPRTDHSGQSAGAMGIKISTAEADYREGAKRLSVKIVDAGGMGMGTLGMAAWASMEVDKEDDKGYEKTSNWGGFKAYEQGRTADKFCSLKLYSKAGIIAEFEGYGVSIAELKEVAGIVKLSSVAGMRE